MLSIYIIMDIFRNVKSKALNWPFQQYSGLPTTDWDKFVPHLRKRSIALEDGIDGSVVGWGLPLQFAADVDLSRCGQFKTDIRRKVVVLSHPERPNSEKNSPSQMESKMSSTATTGPTAAPLLPEEAFR
jgi:hypothetical protein